MKVNYLGKELVAIGYVSSIPEIEETKGFGRGKLNSSDFTLTCQNYDDQFSIDNPKSFLSGAYWQYKNITVYDDEDNKIFDGQVANIVRNHENKTASLICRDKMFQNRKSPIAYTSSDWETPATAAYNIMVAEGFTDYDNATIQASISTMTSASCYCKVSILQTDNITLFAALELLGQWGAADVYMKANKVHYQHWKAYTGGVSISFDYSDPDKMPLTAPVVTTDEKNMYNDYSIGYNGDLNVPATDAANSNIGYTSRVYYGTQAVPELRSENATTNRVCFKDKTSAVYIGDTYIKRGHYSLAPTAKALQQMQFTIDYNFYKYIELGTYFRMTFSEEGWSAKVFEVAGIKRSADARTIGIEAWEVVT